MEKIEDFFCDNLGLFTLLLILGIFAGLGVFIYHDETVAWPASYAAWCKQTDNPKHLTYEEWRALNEATRPRDNTTVVTVPIYH